MEGGNAKVQAQRASEEALFWVAQSKTEEEKQLLLELVCTLKAGC